MRNETYIERPVTVPTTKTPLLKSWTMLTKQANSAHKEKKWCAFRISHTKPIKLVHTSTFLLIVKTSFIDPNQYSFLFHSS